MSIHIKLWSAWTAEVMGDAFAVAFAPGCAISCQFASHKEHAGSNPRRLIRGARHLGVLQVNSSGPNDFANI